MAFPAAERRRAPSPRAAWATGAQCADAARRCTMGVVVVLRRAPRLRLPDFSVLCLAAGQLRAQGDARPRFVPSNFSGKHPRTLTVVAFLGTRSILGNRRPFGGGCAQPLPPHPHGRRGPGPRGPEVGLQPRRGSLVEAGTAPGHGGCLGCSLRVMHLFHFVYLVSTGRRV